MAQVTARFLIPLKDKEPVEMTVKEQLEQEIREILTTETHAISLSDRLFSPAGLFARLAETKEERRQLVETPLFKEAQQRLTALQREEATAFTRAVARAEAALPEGGYRLRVEMTQ